MTPAGRSAALLGAAAIAGYAAISPPLDALADRSFAWHMAQHVLVVFVVAFLAVAADPFVLIARAVSKPVLARLVRGLRPLHVLAVPWVTLPFFLAVLWITHFSPLYEVSLERPCVHALEHVLYFVAGVAFWLPVLAPPPLRPQSHPVRILYLIVALPQAALIAMALISARVPLYVHYAKARGAGAALADQHAAAAVMWIAGGLVVLATLLCTVASWARREMRDYPAEGGASA